MFNLEQSITQWREQMLTAGIKSPVPLEELENHLREEIARLERSGLHQQQAFEDAVLKIGPAQELKTEFSSVSRWREILGIELFKETPHSMMVQAVCLVACNLVIGIFIVYKLDKMPSMTSPEYMSAVAAIVLSNLLFSSGILGRRFFPVIPGKLARFTIGIAFLLLIVLWVTIFATHINFDMGRFMMAFCWAFNVPMGALGGLIFGLDLAARKKPARPAVN